MQPLYFYVFLTIVIMTSIDLGDKGFSFVSWLVLAAWTQRSINFSIDFGVEVATFKFYFKTSFMSMWEAIVKPSLEHRMDDVNS